MITATVSLTNPLLKPFFVLYTKTGSKRTYETSALLIEGEKVIFYFGESGYIPQNNDQLRLIRLVASHDDGLVLPEMPVQFLTMHSDSAFETDKFEMCCENVGFRIINITCNYNLATPVSGGGGVSSNVNITESIELPVKNTQLNKLSFYDSGITGNYLKAILPELTNVHIMGQEDDIKVEVVNTVTVSNTVLSRMTFADDDALQVRQKNDSQVYIYTGVNFTSLTLGGHTQAVNISNSSIQAVFGKAQITGMSLGVSLGIEYSADNSTWYNSQTSLYMNNDVSFGSSYALGPPWIRLVLGGTVDSIDVNLCLK